MNELKERLERMRTELRGELASDIATLSRDVDEKGEDTTPSQHPADVASDLYAREELVVEEISLRRQLSLVDDALARMRDGTYGTCVDCGKPIAPERLEAVPEAARCIDCQRRADRGR
ncbi:MAG TPA: TraR/DksA C4-type zinc finger protein [Candidatus Limnocylindria bacterium]